MQRFTWKSRTPSDVNRKQVAFLQLLGFACRCVSFLTCSHSLSYTSTSTCTHPHSKLSKGAPCPVSSTATSKPLKNHEGLNLQRPPVPFALGIWNVGPRREEKATHSSSPLLPEPIGILLFLIQFEVLPPSTTLFNHAPQRDLGPGGCLLLRSFYQKSGDALFSPSPHLDFI